MKSPSAAILLASFLSVTVPVAAHAGPIMPIESVREALGEGHAIEEVRWVQRCHNVRVMRRGHLVSVRRCGRVWVRP